MKILFELLKLSGGKKGDKIISVVPLQFKQIQSGDYEASSLLNDVQVKLISHSIIKEIEVNDLKKNKKILIKTKDGSCLEIVVTNKEFEMLKNQLQKTTRRKLTLIKKRK